MPTLVYFLCALTSGACSFLLYRQYRRGSTRLLFWAMVCFVGLFVGNILLVVDLVFLPREIDLSIVRSSVTLASLSCMIFGFVWEAE